MQFSQNIDGFIQNDSQGFLELIKLYKQNPLEIFIYIISTIYQNYNLALSLYEKLETQCYTCRAKSSVNTTLQGQVFV